MVVTAQSLSSFAALLAEPSRAAICLVLLDGRAWTAGELARHVGIAPSTASEHLGRLVEAGLLVEARQGRHRYLQLAGPDVARLLEDLSAVVGRPEAPRTLRSVRQAGHLALARTCYDHLAGEVGVALFDALVANELIRVQDGLAVTEAGRAWFTAFLADEPRPSSRPLVRTCLDWTQRRSHLGGALAARLHQELLGRGWVVPRPQRRAVAVTPAGAQGLAELLAVDFYAFVRSGRAGRDRD